MQTDKLSATTEMLDASATYTADATRDEVAEAMRILAMPSPPGESVKSCLRKAYARIRHPEIKARTVRGFWYGEVKVIPGHILDYVRAKRDAHRAYLDNDLIDLKRRLAKLEGREG